MKDWLEQTRELQTTAYGKDPSTLEGDELAEFIRWNHTAAVVELSEMLEETRWKPWASRGDDEPVIPDRQAFLKEAVDVGHFIANMLVAAGISTEEYWESYAAKMQVNRERQQRVSGYQSRRGVDKCLRCGRSFDDVGETHNAKGLCIKCGEEIGKDTVSNAR